MPARAQIEVVPASPPRQARSRASMDRVLAATEALLAERLLEEITLTEILCRARVSVGAFYARFGNRDAIVPLLHDRYDERVLVIGERVLDPVRFADKPLDVRVRLLVRYAVRVYRRNRGLLRALVLEWRTHPERITDLQRARREDFYERIATVLAGDGRDIAHADAHAAARFAFLVFGATCRELLLMASAELPLPSEAGSDDRALCRQLASTVYGYLAGKTLPPAGASS